jgi:hypothetical protein
MDSWIKGWALSRREVILVVIFFGLLAAAILAFASWKSTSVVRSLSRRAYARAWQCARRDHGLRSTE